jgi:hypothetical protein
MTAPLTRCRRVNDTGIGVAGRPGEHLRDIRFYQDGGSIQLWVEVRAPKDSASETVEVLQYLSPPEAMAISKTLERLAIQAFKDSAEEEL